MSRTSELYKCQSCTPNTTMTISARNATSVNDLRIWTSCTLVCRRSIRPRCSLSTSNMSTLRIAPRSTIACPNSYKPYQKPITSGT